MNVGLFNIFFIPRESKEILQIWTQRYIIGTCCYLEKSFFIALF